MISEKYNYLFVHRGKSAGNSISEALLPFSDDKKVVNPSYQDGVDRFDITNETYGTKKHFRLQEYKDVLPIDLFQRLFKFAVLRNPYARVISSYFSPHRVVEGAVGTELIRDDFINHIKGQPTFRDFVCVSEKQPLDADIDAVLKFENLQHDFDAVCLQLGIPKLVLPTRNRRSNRPPYQDYLDPELRRIVEDRFGEEIEFGKYCFQAKVLQPL